MGIRATYAEGDMLTGTHSIRDDHREDAWSVTITRSKEHRQPIRFVPNRRAKMGNVAGVPKSRVERTEFT